MDSIQRSTNAFIQLGKFLSQFSTDGIQKDNSIPFNDLFFDGFKHQIKIAEESNSWFTKNNILFALQNWSQALTEQNINQWIQGANIGKNKRKKIAIIMAGNIPLVGFHDFISVLMAGHAVVVKQSSNDKHLLPFLAKYLEYVLPEWKGQITFTENTLQNYDAVIATGSNNTARYFDYYFKDKPNIIRKNRNSVAVLSGKESAEDLEQLGNDIFTYFGLGCRSVSKLFVPKEYNFDSFFKGMYSKRDIINNAKYANNYDYNKAVYLMSEFDILENGFLMIKEDQSYASPIATVFYEYYENDEALKEKLKKDQEKIQCLVAKNFSTQQISFGKTQAPNLWDYADGINTLDFLGNL
ncbi:acyl-CoA reductase [Tenacibaculum sp. SG-28]|uniref:acyl-CoA reductase n=1 Tax=Tenacibaculum sp. SG-28 TaxID=754426 RepID=UPI000CF40372|nr:acyl-CoA reductase [Tenacibaculum sp. SG-28]PQJ23348.1 acyl-CoA reductase [Tenacibaculum sp. SG-28]